MPKPMPKLMPKTLSCMSSFFDAVDTVLNFMLQATTSYTQGLKLFTQMRLIGPQRL
jgi:hypothetical protein